MTKLTKQQRQDVITVALLWAMPAFVFGTIFGAIMMWVIMK